MTAYSKCRGVIRFVLTIVIFHFIIYGKSLADNTYPYSIILEDELSGGALFRAERGRGYSPINYFVKPGWEGASLGIFKWSGESRKNASEKPIQNVVSLASTIFNDNLITIWREGQVLYIAIIDSTLNLLSISPLTDNFPEYEKADVEIMGLGTSSKFLIKLNRKLFLANIEKNSNLNVSFISDDVSAATVLDKNHKRIFGKSENQVSNETPLTSNTSINGFAYIVGKSDVGLLHLADDFGSVSSGVRMQIWDNTSLHYAGDELIAVTNTANYSNSLIHSFNLKTKATNNYVIEANQNFIGFHNLKKSAQAFFLLKEGNGYTLVLSDVSALRNTENWRFSKLPVELIEPISAWSSNDGIVDNNDKSNNVIYALFRNGIVSVSESGELLSLDYYPFGEKFDKKPCFSIVADKMILSSAYSSIVLQIEQNQFYLLNRFLENRGKYVFPAILILVCLVLLQLYRHQKRFLNTILDLPSSGIIFQLDKSGHLIRANQDGRIFLGINEQISYRKHIRYYCQHERAKPIADILEKALNARVTLTEKANIPIGSDTKEYICTAIPIRNIAGVFRGVVFTGVDITEQLERRRLSTWAQLAHDMQTNLSTIRLNAEQLQFSENCGADNSNIQLNLDRKKRIIHQVNLLIQRIRDIVTVGRTEMAHKDLVEADEICREARNEFDEIMFPDIEFVLETQSFRLNCDKPKLIRAIRNAIENGIRSMQGKPGKISISCKSDSRFAYFSIKDTGAGMDEATKKRFLTPYFTTSKKQGGSGIGTMIMQHVAELHGGSISVNTEQGAGTEIIFTIPNYAKKFHLKAKI